MPASTPTAPPTDSDSDSSGVRARTTSTAAGLARTVGVLFGHSAFRFLVSGGAGAAVDAGMLYLLHGKAGVWLPLATFLSVATSYGVNFTLNRFWSFNSVARVGGQMARYLILAAGNWIFNVAMVTGLAALGLHYLVAKFITLAVAGALNYVSYRIWVFR
jgi:putative flippase GtrA